MSRGLTAAVVTELAKKEVWLVWFVEVVTEAETVRFHSGTGDLSWNSQIWKGVGELLDIGPVSETADLQANGLTITLNGIPTSVTGGLDLGDMLNQLAPDNDVTVWFGFRDGEGGAIIVGPFEWFKGLTSHATLTDSVETSSIALQCEHELIIFTRNAESRWNSEEQKRRFSGDLFFDFAPKLAAMAGEIVWGQGDSLLSGSGGSNERTRNRRARL